jgi:hypothetical protein
VVALPVASFGWALGSRELSFNERSACAPACLSTLGAIGGFVAHAYAPRHLGEPFNGRIAIAAALVLTGVAIGRWKPVAVRPTPVETARDVGRGAADFEIVEPGPAGRCANASTPGDR